MFSNRLREIRKENNLKQGELASATNISQRVLSGLERGETQPTLKQIEILSAFFRVTTDNLINGNESALNANEKEIIKAVRNDSNLLDKLMQMIASKKEFESMIA